MLNRSRLFSQSSSEDVCRVSTVIVNNPLESMDKEEQLPDWGDKKEQKDMLAERKESMSRLIDVVAYRGHPFRQYQMSMRDMNAIMRENYSEMIRKVGNNIYPLIIASENEPDFPGVGGTFTLFLEDGSAKRIVPTQSEYEIYKGLAHMVLSLFTIISPYFKAPDSVGWESKLKLFQQAINNSLNLAYRNHLFGKPKQDETNRLPIHEQIVMLEMVRAYIDRCFKKKSVRSEDYIGFSKQALPYVKKSLYTAARLQAHAVLPELEKWKEELGDKWRDLYVVIPTVWPVSDRNARQQIFEKLMDPDRIKTHLIKAEGAKDIEEARLVLGRVVGDRTLAHLVFGTDTPENTALNLALSTRRDLISSATDKAIDAYVEECSQRPRI